MIRVINRTQWKIIWQRQCLIEKLLLSLFITLWFLLLLSNFAFDQALTQQDLLFQKIKRWLRWLFRFLGALRLWAKTKTLVALVYGAIRWVLLLKLGNLTFKCLILIFECLKWVKRLPLLLLELILNPKNLRIEIIYEIHVSWYLVFIALFDLFHLNLHKELYEIHIRKWIIPTCYCMTLFLFISLLISNSCCLLSIICFIP